jgi:prepilin-type N-terminal cleavage/methylation domain-containing protein
MGCRSANSSGGFTLIELLVSLAVGALIVGSAVQLFTQGMNATWVVSQRAQMQQDLRASSNLLFKDISLAGAGNLPPGGITLPSGAGAVRPIYGFAPSCPVLNNCRPQPYPCSSALVLPCVPTLFGLIPGWRKGITVPGNATATDMITTVFTDSVFELPCYTIQSITAVAVVVQLPAVLPASCAPPQPPPQPVITNPVTAGGLVPGDLVLVQSTVGGNTAMAVGEVTGVVLTGPNTYTIAFAAADPLLLNQPAAAAGNLAQLVCAAGACPPTATTTRLFVVTYYLWMMPDPLGVGPGTPTLMRQVNGQSTVPVQEGVMNFQFTYDTYDAAGNLLNAVGDGGYSLGTSFNLIRKINLAHLTTQSQLAGPKSGLMLTKGYQTFDTQTSISARNLSFQNRYVLLP